METVSVVGAFFYPDMVKSYFENDLSLQHFQNPVTVSKVHIDPMIRSLMDSLNYLLDNPSIADENLIINKQKELLILLSKSEESESVAALINSLFAPQEYDFREVIEKNIFSDLTVAELAYLCGMSEATFKRKFDTIFNQSPARYILERKLEHAQLLLQIESKAISDIAYACGFSSPSSFNKAFKKHIGSTPSAFRQKQMDKHLS
jgi:AraC-like DNA-binding protein